MHRRPAFSSLAADSIFGPVAHPHFDRLERSLDSASP
jgi:hypothetical protein